MQLQKPEHFFPYFEMEIWCVDKRSTAMPRKISGLLIGITLDKVQLRVGNNITDWYPLNHTKVNFYPDRNSINESL